MSGEATRDVSGACMAGVAGVPRSEPVCSHCGAAGVEPCTGRRGISASRGPFPAVSRVQDELSRLIGVGTESAARRLLAAGLDVEEVAIRMFAFDFAFPVDIDARLLAAERAWRDMAKDSPTKRYFRARAQFLIEWMIGDRS